MGIINLLLGALILFSPVAFAQDAGLVSHNADQAHEGLTLFTPLEGGLAGDGGSRVFLIDMNGDVVHAWDMGDQLGQYAELLPDGTLLYRSTYAHPTSPQVGIVQHLAWDGEMLWEYENDLLHHDMAMLPNGNVMVVMWEGYKGDGSFWSDRIVEIDYDTGEIVWEWSLQDHVELTAIDAQGDELTHVNAVEYLPEGNSYNGREGILISSRELSTVMIVDYETGEIVWEYGPGELLHQHDPTLLENGNVLIFDNRRRNSRVVEVDPQTDEIVWSYEAEGFFSHNVSGAQRLENGNTLITEGAQGRVFEVTSEGEIVWGYVSPFADEDGRNAIFRAHRYDADDVDWPEGVWPYEVIEESDDDQFILILIIGLIAIVAASGFVVYKSVRAINDAMR